MAVKRAKEMVANGADIIDIGGESTRPGFATVPAKEELKRVIPIIKAISEHVQVPISIDTYKAEVAKQAIEAGAHIINDVWGQKQMKRWDKWRLTTVFRLYLCIIVRTETTRYL